MELARAAKQSDPLGRYYTESLIGRHLIKEMNLKAPSTVVDLGAGSGALVQEASKIWTDAKFITVDIDKKAKSATLANLRASQFSHHTADALDFSLAETLGMGWAQAEAAICNPPYVLPIWKEHFGCILEDAGLSHVIPKTGGISSDLLFIAQNLRMLKKEGKLGLILPDGIISGEKHKKLRQALIDMHCINKIIELPRGAFKKTDAKAHILILSKNCDHNEFIPVTRLNLDGTLSQAIQAPAEDFSVRLDYTFLEGRRRYKGRSRIGDAINIMFRGSVSSAQRRELEIPVFHTTDFSESGEFVPKSFYLTKEQLNSYGGPIAGHGDILIARVGRNLSQKVCMLNCHGSVAISDCIIVIRVKHKLRQSIFQFLKSGKGKSCLDAAAKGVGAKYITTNSLSEIQY